MFAGPVSSGGVASWTGHAHQDLVVALPEACQTLLRVVGLRRLPGRRAAAEEPLPLRPSARCLLTAHMRGYARSPWCWSAGGPLTGTRCRVASARRSRRGRRSRLPCAETRARPRRASGPRTGRSPDAPPLTTPPPTAALRVWRAPFAALGRPAGLREV
jgi:hypothetical protein